MIRYICDPDKNTKCRKTFCQEFCKATAFEEYAKRDEHGAPIIAEESDRVPQIKINREVFEKCEEEKETITVSKGCLKARTGRFVVYDVEYLKNHIEQEAAIYRNVSAITDKTEDRRTGRWAVIHIGDELANAYGATFRAIGKSNGEKGYLCTVCNNNEIQNRAFDFCPNCGARMTEVESEDNE